MARKFSRGSVVRMCSVEQRREYWLLWWCREETQRAGGFYGTNSKTRLNRALPRHSPSSQLRLLRLWPVRRGPDARNPASNLLLSCETANETACISAALCVVFFHFLFFYFFLRIFNPCLS